MIDYIKGQIVELTPTYATIENNGIGYFVNISVNTYTQLSGKDTSKVYIHEAIREDAYNLFGFFEKQERDLFLLLISVSGIGPNSARMILSSLSPAELTTVIATGNADILKTVKGIGAKTAQRIIIDLKDKIKTTNIEQIELISAVNPSMEEAIAALVMLGFPQQASQKAVHKLSKEKGNLSVEELIKAALKVL